MKANIHLGHNVLGRYCWTCKAQSEAGVPGWPPSFKGASTSYDVWDSKDGNGYCTAVVWANGDQDTKREGSVCAMCGLFCAYPVNRHVTERGDSYREISSNIVNLS